MAQNSGHIVPLGEQLYFWRRHARWLRRRLAQAAGIAISTVQELETGRGTLTYFITALDALGLVLHARGLGHRRLGTAMRHEREQQEISRRELAAHLKVSRTTLAALERNRSVRISIVDRYALALRIRVVVSPRPHSSGRS